MAVKMVGVGDYGVVKTNGDYLKTMALGSCVAVLMYCPINKIAGMVHIALPDSAINKQHAVQRPGYFADTGIAKLISEMKKYGNICDKRKLIVKIAGGASILDKNNIFNIGGRNISAVRAHLRQGGFILSKQDVGKQISRTVSIDTEGKISISCPGIGVWEL